LKNIEEEQDAGSNDVTNYSDVTEATVESKRDNEELENETLTKKIRELSPKLRGTPAKFKKQEVQDTADGDIEKGKEESTEGGKEVKGTAMKAKTKLKEKKSKVTQTAITKPTDDEPEVNTSQSASNPKVISATRAKRSKRPPPQHDDEPPTQSSTSEENRMSSTPPVDAGDDYSSGSLGENQINDQADETPTTHQPQSKKRARDALATPDDKEEEAATQHKRHKSITLSPHKDRLFALGDSILPEPSRKDVEGTLLERKPNRKRTQRLKYWKGERPIVAKDATGEPRILKLHLVPPTPATSLRKRRLQHRVSRVVATTPTSKRRRLSSDNSTQVSPKASKKQKTK